MLKDFKSFVLRGSVVDLAVAIVIGVAFSALITALVRDLLTPVVALIFGRHDFSALTFAINGSVFRYGDFINYLVALLSVAAAVFFFVVQPMNTLIKLRPQHSDAQPDTRPCSECLSEIRQEARRCAFCASEQVPSGA